MLDVYVWMHFLLRQCSHIHHQSIRGPVLAQCWTPLLSHASLIIKYRSDFHPLHQHKYSTPSFNMYIFSFRAQLFLKINAENHQIAFQYALFVKYSTLQRTNIFSVHFSPFLGDSVVLCDKNLAQCSKNTIAGSLRGEGATTGFR